MKLSIVLALLAFIPNFCLSKGTTCKGLPCWYQYYNHKYFSDSLPKTVDVDYGPCDGLVNVIACSWTDRKPDGQIIAYIRLIPDQNQAPNVSHMNLLHEQCHLATPYVGHDHGDEWQACMHRLANEKAFDSLW